MQRFKDVKRMTCYTWNYRVEIYKESIPTRRSTYTTYKCRREGAGWILTNISDGNDEIVFPRFKRLKDAKLYTDMVHYDYIYKGVGFTWDEGWSAYVSHNGTTLHFRIPKEAELMDETKAKEILTI